MKAGRYDRNGFKERKQDEVKRREIMARGRREEGDGTAEDGEQTNEEKK